MMNLLAAWPALELAVAEVRVHVRQEHVDALREVAAILGSSKGVRCPTIIPQAL